MQSRREVHVHMRSRAAKEGEGAIGASDAKVDSCTSFTRSINHSITHSRQSINHSIMHSINQSLDHWQLNQSINQSITRVFRLNDWLDREMRMHNCMNDEEEARSGMPQLKRRIRRSEALAGGAHREFVGTGGANQPTLSDGSAASAHCGIGCNRENGPTQCQIGSGVPGVRPGNYLGISHLGPHNLFHVADPSRVRGPFARGSAFTECGGHAWQSQCAGTEGCVLVSLLVWCDTSDTDCVPRPLLRLQSSTPVDERGSLLSLFFACA